MTFFPHSKLANADKNCLLLHYFTFIGKPHLTVFKLDISVSIFIL